MEDSWGAPLGAAINNRQNTSVPLRNHCRKLLLLFAL